MLSSHARRPFRLCVLFCSDKLDFDVVTVWRSLLVWLLPFGCLDVWSRLAATRSEAVRGALTTADQNLCLDTLDRQGESRMAAVVCLQFGDSDRDGCLPRSLERGGLCRAHVFLLNYPFFFRSVILVHNPVDTVVNSAFLWVVWFELPVGVTCGSWNWRCVRIDIHLVHSHLELVRSLLFFRSSFEDNAANDDDSSGGSWRIFYV